MSKGSESQIQAVVDANLIPAFINRFLTLANVSFVVA